MQNFKAKITSRKFLIAIAGIVSGIALIVNGNTTEGVTTIVASVVAYLAAEGVIDMMAVQNTTDKAEQLLEKIDNEEE